MQRQFPSRLFLDVNDDGALIFWNKIRMHAIQKSNLLPLIGS